MNRLVVCCIALSLSAQTPTFEVASIKAAAPTPGRGGRAIASGDRITYANTTLLNVLARAYQVKGFQVDGPAWIKTERYDILAKAPDNTPPEQIPLMLQSLLHERFQLQLHREPREMPVYALVTGNGKPKFQRSDGELSYDLENGRRILQNHTMAQLADFLSPMVQRLVFDRTGLSGAYNFPLEMSMEELGGINAKPEASAPSIFTIIEGLGLKLESRREPVEVVVIDSGNKVPTGN
jgi:uncharacterized protein (TIGR03435 family)